MTRKRNFVCSMFLVLCISMVMILFGGCGSFVKMPFNGEVQFHDMIVTVPEKFIRDSTQSKENVWIFEHSGYSEYIILSRNDIGGDIMSELESYKEYIEEQGADSEITVFLEKDAVHSTYVKDDVYCQEMLFAHGDSFYAVALRGGTEKEFEAILKTVKIP